MRHSIRDAFGLIAALWIVFGATQASAQGRCTQPVARIVSAEGDILVRPASGLLIVTIVAGAQGDICPGESVQAGSRSRAAVLLLSSNQIIRLDQNTTIRVIGETPQQRSLIDLVQGFIRLFNPVGRALDVRTPFVTAGTEGTEFYVAYEPQNEDTTAGVIDGIVRVAKNGDEIRLGPGEAVRAPRTGPFQRLNIRPRDAVRWTIFYPAAIWNLPPAEEAALDPRVARAWQAWRNGDLSAFVNALNAVPPQAPLDARSLLRFAALLLIVGQVDEASGAIARAEAMNAGNPLIPALRSVIAVAENRTDEALALSERALGAARTANDPAALVGPTIARSYALQSAFRLEEARNILASVEASGDPLVFARLAEIDLSLGNNSDARREAQRASQLAPSLSLASSILGFSSLANFEFDAARTSFEKAATLSPGDPLAHLGLGLTSIRSGNLENGRREMAIAVALDPESAVARSYLGKTYASIGLSEPDIREAAFREWALAEAADPKDPTAPLYRAFAERALNRPVEALEDIQRSIELNDNRAVYRSRLLLDQDLATRTTDLASVYRDLGFDQLAVSEGYKSVNVDPANSGAHRFLSDSYLSMPRHESASDSELLQSLLLQPLNVQPLRPRLAREGLGILDLRGPSRIGFNEFSPVFASNGLSLLADAFGGTQGTYGENLVVSGIHENVSFSLGQFYYRTDGIRTNNQLRRDIENGLLQVALSDRVSLLAEYRHSQLKAGDSSLFFDPSIFSPRFRQEQERSQYRLGGRVDVAPGASLVAVWTREHLAGLSDPGENVISISSKSNGDFVEGAIYFSRDVLNLIAGGGYFDADSPSVTTFFGRRIPANISIIHTNGWVYANAGLFERLQFTLGGSFDEVKNGNIRRNRVNPKAGLSWDMGQGSVFRAAYFESIKRTTIGGQTLEPTQIAGFNQLFDDPAATMARRWGAGFDQKLTGTLFAGIEWSQRELDVPAATPSNPAGLQNWKEDLARSYVDWIISGRFSLNLGLQWERFARDPTKANSENLAKLDLIRVPAELRYYDPSGLFALLRTTFVRESGRFRDFNFKLFDDDDTFAVVDTSIGWRMPGRAVVGTIEVRNLLNSGFRFQDTDPTNPMIVPARIIMGRFTFSF